MASCLTRLSECGINQIPLPNTFLSSTAAHHYAFPKERQIQIHTTSSSIPNFEFNVYLSVWHAILSYGSIDKVTISIDPPNFHQTQIGVCWELIVEKLETFEKNAPSHIFFYICIWPGRNARSELWQEKNPMKDSQIILFMYHALFQMM